MPNAPDAGLPNPAAYTVTADTVIDQVTGLEWQKGTVGRTSNYYDLYWGDAQLYCEQLVLGGQSDWRLPSRIELVSLALESLEPGQYPGSEMPGDYVLPAARGSWSASRLAWNQDYWYPWVSGGYTSFGLVIYPGEVRCVRTASSRQLAAQRFTTNTDTVLDNWTGLTWVRPFDPSKRGTWASAVAGCAALNIQGGGWRLPTQKELQTLVDETRVGPAIDTGLFPGTAPVTFWSSASFLNSSNGQTYPAFVDFNLGQALQSEPNTERYFRCVK